MGGRIVLINVVLNALPDYSLSFYKGPSKVLKEIRWIQRNLLWLGNENKRIIHWVSWEVLASKISNYSTKLFWLSGNVGLWGKKKAIWSMLLRHRYKNLVVKMFCSNKNVNNKGDSIGGGISFLWIGWSMKIAILSLLTFFMRDQIIRLHYKNTRQINFDLILTYIKLSQNCMHHSLE